MKAIFRWRKAEAELEFLMQKIQKKKMVTWSFWRNKQDTPKMKTEELKPQKVKAQARRLHDWRQPII